VTRNSILKLAGPSLIGASLLVWFFFWIAYRGEASNPDSNFNPSMYQFGMKATYLFDGLGFLMWLFGVIEQRVIDLGHTLGRANDKADEAAHL